MVHVHAKDLMIDRDGLYDHGILSPGMGWQVPRMPGLGEVDWQRVLFATLYRAGYDGPIIIEHEDRTFEGSDERSNGASLWRGTSCVPTSGVQNDNEKWIWEDHDEKTASWNRAHWPRPLAGMAAAEGYKIGISNTVQGNGWREEMVCAMKAAGAGLGQGRKSLNIAHRNTDAAGQLEDIRNLIQAGVNAIVVNPANADGINAAIKEATDAGIVVVAVDQAVTEPSAYILSNNQEEYAYIGAKWLFEQMGGKGGRRLHARRRRRGADNDRDKGFKRALAEFPDVTVAQEVFTGWQQDQGKQQINDYHRCGRAVRGSGPRASTM
jgi:hypothetical protein